MMTLQVVAIAAMDERRVIGMEGKLPWHCPEDLRHFSQCTKGHTVLMGRTTFDSLPEKFRPLPQRKNIVITSRSILEAGVEVWSSPQSCISHYRSNEQLLPSTQIWIIGGAQLYAATLPLWDRVELTIVPGSHRGDTYFPNFESDFMLHHERNGESCRFLSYVRRS